MRQATVADLDLLIGMMEEFYAEAGYRADVVRARDAFRQLLEDERLGEVWVAEANHTPVGYIVLTFGFSMEYGGPDAFIVDLFLQSGHRGGGLGSALVRHARERCTARGVRALHLEVGRENARARAVYGRAGFRETDRLLLTLQLAPPAHLA
jgi:GNAT superfamily N-acetyltransferase